MNAQRGRRRSSEPEIGRPPKVGPDDVARAVLHLGFIDVTVPRVAEALGVTAATVYRHVPDRGSMLEAAWDLVIDSVEWPALRGSWREALSAYAFRFWDLLADHPGVVSALSTGLVPERTMDVFLRLTGYLYDEGFTMPDALLVVDTVMDAIVDHRLGVERLDGPRDHGVSREQMRASWRPRGDDGVIDAARSAMSDAIAMEPRAWIGRKIDLILDGAAARLSR